jgi:hypothetical protein
MPEKGHGQPVTGPFIFDHVSFGVDTKEALWELKDKLEAGGFDVSDVIDHGFIQSIPLIRMAFPLNSVPQSQEEIFEKTQSWSIALHQT